MFTVAQIDEHLIGMGHSSSLNKVRSKEAMYERAASIFCLKVKNLERIRTSALASTIHDDFYNYAVAVDFGELIDLVPQDNQNSWDQAYRTTAGKFNLQKALADKTLSIEGNEGIKTARINWRSRQGKVLASMNETTGWTAQGSATGIVLDTITRFSGGGSVRFNVVASGDGIKNIALDSQDFTNEDEIADVFVWVYVPIITNLTSITGVWGNDVTTKYWTGVAQTTQADGSAFRAGWNLIRIPWATATETGTVVPTAIDSFKIIFTTAGAIANVRVDNIVFSIGRNFDMKYYSKYLFKNATSGTWQSRPTVNNTDDYVLIDNDTLPLFLMEVFTAMAHQLEGTDSKFDLDFAMSQMKQLYPIVLSQMPNMAKRTISKSTAGPRMRRFGRM